MNAANGPKVTETKWGEAVTRFGFQIVPALLLKKQSVLGLDDDGKTEAVSAPELVVLLNVLMHWWTKDSAIFPSAQMIADRIGVTRRSVDRSVESLVRKHLLSKERDGNLVFYDPNPLVQRLAQLATERNGKEID